ncbi:MAG TPA: DUF2625 family protein [Mycobacteriales bacterium]
MRELGELVDVEDPAWPVLLEQVSASLTAVEVLPVDASQAGPCLVQLQVTVRSCLGALAFHTGGLRVDGGWLRVFGGSHSGGAAGLPGLSQVNRFPEVLEPEWRPVGGLVLAHDVLGGVFALNGADTAASGRPGQPGEVVYFAPDRLEWEALGVGHGAWVAWLLSGQLDQFYEGLRWPGWQEEVAALSGSEGTSVVPFLWTAEAQRDLAATSRRAVPMTELLGLSSHFCRQLGLPVPGFRGEPSTPTSRATNGCAVLPVGEAR